jgi:ElaB/YqjD/DUF883 family membrane-anchored ribosome-binding protein
MDQQQQWAPDSPQQQKNLKQKVSSEAERAKSRFAEAAAPMKEQAREFAERQKRAGAEQIGGVARAVHGAADRLEQDLPFAAEYVRQAAGTIEGAADKLRQNSVDDIAKSIADFARAQPLAFIGGAVLAGFVLARFLKSSERPSAPSREGGWDHASGGRDFTGGAGSGSSRQFSSAGM